jgi:hypothetical protein
MNQIGIVDLTRDSSGGVYPGNSSVSEHSECSLLAKPQIDFSPNASVVKQIGSCDLKNRVA